MAAIGGNITTMRRQIKNVVGNYSEAQIKVREATSNDPWGPSSSLMSEIADLTYNAIAFTEIMQMLWKRLNDHGKNWRHVYKSLVVLDYLVKLGSEKVAHQCRENIFAIQTLKDFQHIEDDKDQGLNVREKAKHLVALLKDEERLKNERAKAATAKKRFMQNGMGISFDGTTNRVKKSETFHTDSSAEVSAVPSRTRRSSELEECRPSSAGEEELQLQIALALSKEDAQKEEELRKNDDLRLQMALNESCGSSGGSTKSAPDFPFKVKEQRSTSSAIDDFFSAPLSTGGAAAHSTAADAAGVSNDPWASAMPVRPPPATVVNPPAAQNDPWNDFSKSRINSSTSNADPWSPSATSNTGASIGNQQHVRNNWVPLDTNDPFNPNAMDFNKPNSSDQTMLGVGIDELDAFLSSPLKDDTNSTAAMTSSMANNNKRSKTPADFLGENSALVNLDNLLGPSKPLISVTSNNPQQPQQQQNGPKLNNKPVETNPFLVDSASSANGTTTNNNPFAQAPPLTLNQLRAHHISPPNAAAAFLPPTNSSGAGAFPPSAVANPNRPSSTNPFM